MADETRLMLTAYHESAHVVISYYFHYTCDDICVLPTGDGFSSLNYAADNTHVAAICNFGKEPWIFEGLDAKNKNQCVMVAIPTTLILMAGSVAEAILKKDIQDDLMTVEISGPDLIRVQQIDKFLSTHRKNHVETFVADLFGMLHVLIDQNPEIWKAIENLAQALLASENKRLNRNEIEAVLKSSGFFEFRNNSSD